MKPLSFLASAVFLLGAAFFIFRIPVRNDYLKNGRLSLLSSFLQSLIFFMFGLFTWFDLPPGWPPSNISLLLRIAAWILIVFGLMSMFSMMIWFGIRRSCGREVNILMRSGVYRFTRNPQIIACTLAVTGYALLWPSWHTLGWVVLYLAIAHMMVLTEEEHLRNAHGEEYKQYANRVARYFGFPRPAKNNSPEHPASGGHGGGMKDQDGRGHRSA